MTERPSQSPRFDELPLTEQLDLLHLNDIRQAQPIFDRQRIKISPITIPPSPYPPDIHEQTTNVLGYVGHQIESGSSSILSVFVDLHDPFSPRVIKLIHLNQINTSHPQAKTRPIDPHLRKKIIAIDQSQKELLRMQAETEAKTLMALKSPTLVPIERFVYDQDGNPGIIMPDLTRQTPPYKTLRTQLEACDFIHWTFSERITFLTHLRNAFYSLYYHPLVVAHPAHPFVFRDHKPENILMREEKPFIQFVDVGISSWTYEHETHGKATLDYLAPEMASEEILTYTPAFDTYSAAIIVYEILTGTYFRNGSDDFQKMIALFAEQFSLYKSEYKPLKDILEQYGINLNQAEEIFSTAFQKNPKHRYQNPVIFLNHLLPILLPAQQNQQQTT